MFMIYMKRTNDPFLINLPTIDLHGEDKISAIIKTKELITDSLKLKEYKIVVIHGIGNGILKNAIHDYLKNDRRVETFKTDNFNNGMTIIKLKPTD